jgi:hypothetical protein
MRQDEPCAEHWEELSAVRKVAFYPDSIGEANSFAASIQSQPRFYGKAVRSGGFAFCTRSACTCSPSLSIFRSDLIDIPQRQSIIALKAKEFGLNRCPFRPGQMMTPDKGSLSRSHVPGKKIPSTQRRCRTGHH